MTSCQWISSIDPVDQEWWGERLAKLATASRSSVPVLPGFVISREVYQAFFELPTLKREITKACKGLSLEKQTGFSQTAATIRHAVMAATFPASKEAEVVAYYEELRTHLFHTARKPLPLRLRLITESNEEITLTVSVSSSTAFLKACKQLYALRFSDQALYDRYVRNTSIIGTAQPMQVQYFPESEFSGWGQAHDRQTTDDTVAEIGFQRGVWHEAGEDIAYRIDLKSKTILTVQEEYSLWQQEASGKIRSRRPHHPIDEKKIIHLAGLLKVLQQEYSDIQRFFWTYAHGQFWITDVLAQPSQQKVSIPTEGAITPLITGIGASLGRIVGTVRRVLHPADIQHLLPGDIAVLRALTPADIQWLGGVKGVIVEHGSPAGPEATLVKRFHIPAVIAARGAVSHLTDGQLITMDAATGTVYAGRVTLPSQPAQTGPVTGTHLLTTVLDPLAIHDEQVRNADGIGLLRSEFILELLGQHPRDIARQGRQTEYIEALADEVGRLARLVAPHPLTYQFHDPLDYPLHQGRQGAQKAEPNPLLGYRGTHRLLQEPEVLELELAALTRLAESGVTNIRLLMPMAHSTEEIKKFGELLHRHTLAHLQPLKLWVRCDTPALAILAEQLPSLGLAGVLIDVVGLAQLVTGIDGINMQMAPHLQQSNEAVLQAVEYVSTTCRHFGMEVVITAEGAPLDPEVVERAVMAGASGVSVVPEELDRYRRLVATIEQRMLLTQLLEESKETVLG